MLKILPWLKKKKPKHHSHHQSFINVYRMSTGWVIPSQVWYLGLTHHYLPCHDVPVIEKRVDVILCMWLFGLLGLFGPPQIANGFNAEGFLVKVPTCYEVCVLTDCFSCWLVAVKSKLAVTASIHVYSIQKAMLKDSGPLFNTDYDILKSNLQNCSKWAP